MSSNRDRSRIWLAVGKCHSLRSIHHTRCSHCHRSIHSRHDALHHGCRRIGCQPSVDKRSGPRHRYQILASSLPNCGNCCSVQLGVPEHRQTINRRFPADRHRGLAFRVTLCLARQTGLASAGHYPQRSLSWRFRYLGIIPNSRWKARCGHN